MNSRFVQIQIPQAWSFIRNRAKVAGVVALCFALSACARIGGGGGGTGSPGSSGLTPISISASSLMFGSQPVGTKSMGQAVTLTNKSTSTVNISISATGNYTEVDNCGASLAAGASCTVNAAFSPSSTGPQSGTLVVSDGSPGGSQIVNLSGMGTTTGGGGIAGTGCTGASLTQVQANVTSQMSYANSAAGVQVSQLTDNAMNRFYYFDVPAYSTLVNQILYVDNSSGNVIVTSNTDGTGAQQISPTNTGNQSFVSEDGTFAYYPKPVLGGTPGGEDIYGVFLNNPGACQELRLTNVDLKVQAPLPVWEISTSSPDAAGGQDIAFSPDTLMHRVHVLADGTSQALPTITLNDPESSATFHRLRLNPKFPNIVMYKRNEISGTTAEPEAWLADINTCVNGTCSASQIINVVQKLIGPAGQTAKAGHITWSPDGLDVLFSETDIADYWIARNVVNSNGTLNAAFTLQELGPFVKPQITADYCALPPEWPTATVLACLAGPASPSNAKTLYLMSSDGLGTVKILTATDAQVLTIAGTPMPQFVQDSTHLMFNSDRTGLTQIYLVSGFTASVP
jgi:hypothetical protein